MGEYHGELLSVRFRAWFYRSRYFVWANALHPAKTCETLSGSFPHSRHLSSPLELLPVFLLLYTFPATVCDGAAFRWESHAKQSRSNCSSSHQHAVSFPCHFCSSVLSWCSFTSAFFIHTPIFFFSIFSPSFVLPTGSGCLSTSSKSSSEAYFCASFINDRLPVRTDFSSNCRTSFMVEYLLAYWLITALILFALYSASTDLRPHPPNLLGRTALSTPAGV